MRLREVIIKISAEHGFGKNVQQMMGGLGKDMGDGLWYGAKGVAVITRRLVWWHGGDACLPNSWCEIARYHDEL